MSESNTSGTPDARAPSPTPSERSIKSDVSTASSRLPKPTGMRPPQATISSGASTSTAAPATPSSSRIGRLCTAHGHGAKAGPPPLELNKSECCCYRSMTSNYLDYKKISWRRRVPLSLCEEKHHNLFYDQKCPVNTRCMEETHAHCTWTHDGMKHKTECVHQLKLLIFSFFFLFAWLL